MPTLHERIESIRSRISIHLPFYSAIGMTLHVEEAPVGTAGVTSTHMYFDPAFVAKLNDKQLAYVYCHECGHKALMHAWRRGARERGVWNNAADYVINLGLDSMHSPLLERPKMEGKDFGLFDSRFDGMSEEEVYEKLLEEGESGSDAFMPDVLDDPSRSQADMEIEILNIAKAAKMAGESGGLVDMILKRNHKAYPHYKDVLRDFLTSVVKVGTNWSRPSRRTQAAGVVLPSLRSPAMGSIVVFGDVSGSMVPLVQKILGEMQGLLDEVNPEETYLVFGDTRVTATHVVPRGGRIGDVKVQGGGGTDFRPLFKEVETRGWRPMCGVFLTDTCGTFPKVPPPYPVVWGVLGAEMRDVQVPWGQKMRIREA